MLKRNIVGFLALAVWAPGSALAGGHIISEMGSRAAGRAGAATALTDSPQAVFFNPANVVMLPGLQVELGASVMAPRWGFSSANGGDTITDVRLSTPPALSLTYGIGNFGFGDLAVGLGVYVPYGGNVAWSDDWQGRTEVQSMQLQALEISPVLSWRPHKMVSIGGGVRFMPASVYMKRAVAFGDQQEGAVELAGQAQALAASAGVSVFPMEGLSIGFSWRSEAAFKFRGDSHFDFPPPFDTEARDRDAEAVLPTPQVLRLGFAYDVLPQTLNVSLDLEYQMWSTFERLDITFIDGEERETLSAVRNARNTLVIHVGGEYRLTDAIAIRAGYAYDPYILPENTVNPAPPDSDRHLASVGMSYFFMEDFGVHAHFSTAFFIPRDTATNSMPGTWTGGWGGDVMAFIGGITLSARFGAAPQAAETAVPVAEE